MNKIQNPSKSDFFDAWEFPQACVCCSWYDNNDENEPIAILDVTTKLCESCFIGKQEES